MPKIIHLITSLGGGGTENFLLQILTRSPPSYHHSVFYLKKDGVNGQRLRERGIFVKKTTAREFKAALEVQCPDVLHTLLYRAHQVGRWVGHRAGVPIILSSQRSIDTWQKPWHRMIDAWTLRWCDGVLANSNAAQTLIEKRRDQKTRPRVVRISNGIDMDQWIRQDRWKSRQAYGLPMDATVAGSLMRLHREKGADRIPAFAGALLKAQEDLHIVIAGTGPLERTLRRQTEGQSWSPRLHWLGWEPQALRLYSALDFYWLLSREESFPQSLLEASALGIPWIAPDVGGTRELQQTASGGIIYSPQAPQGAEHSAFELLRLHNEMKVKAVRAEPAIRAQYSLDKMTQTFYRTVESFLAQNRPHSL